MRSGLCFYLLLPTSGACRSSRLLQGRHDELCRGILRGLRDPVLAAVAPEVAADSSAGAMGGPREDGRYLLSVPRVGRG